VTSRAQLLDNRVGDGTFVVRSNHKSHAWKLAR